MRTSLILVCALLATLTHPAPLPADAPLYDRPRSGSSVAETQQICVAADAEQHPFVAPVATDVESRGAEGALLRAEAWQKRGEHHRAIRELREAEASAGAAGDARRLALVAGTLGSSYLAIGDLQSAEVELDRSLAVARSAGLLHIEAATLTNLGNLLARKDSSDEAVSAYREAFRLALETGEIRLAARGAVNAARLLATKHAPAAEDMARSALAQLERTPPDAEHALLLISVGLVFRQIDKTEGARDQGGRPHAPDLLHRASEMARAAGDARVESFALGYLGGVHEEQGRNDEALRLTRRALFLAQSAEAPEALYAWQWQAGRLLAARGDAAAAIHAYQDAVATLQSIRADLPAVDPETGRSLFREAVSPVFLELSDLLLREARASGDRGSAQQQLSQARLTVEQLKAVELEDYFQDDCVGLLQARIRPVDQLAERTAALYPIALPERLVLLVSLPDGLVQVDVPVESAVLMEEAHTLRRMLEKLTTHQYLPHAQRLYDWLIRPIEAQLLSRNIDTLVFLPDGALRTIPLAALHDGQRFLVNRYAVVTEQGLTLVDPQAGSRDRATILLGGLTRPVQGFAPLPYVADELGTLRKLFGSRAEVLQDDRFVAEQVADALESGSYSLVHIASHGQFASKPENSFILTFDARLNMNQLEAVIRPSLFRDRPIELLTLSACRTAAGDDRAALGLAGMAVKAGARSVVAGLWHINDRASALLVSEFYRHLNEPRMSKAQALQNAQLGLLQDPRYTHPGYWSPFLLIGNWQ